MLRFVGVIGVLGVGLVGWFYWKGSTKTVLDFSPASISKLSSKKSSPRAPEVKSEKKDPTEMNRGQAAEVSELKHRNEIQVSFQVIDGLAVAMGDLILGRPEDEEIKKGMADLPIPQYWEKPEIPYYIDKTVVEPGRVLQAIHHLEEKTGLKFLALTPQDAQESHPDALVFQTGNEHCLSMLGKQGGFQPIRISPKCSWSEIVHEVMHSLGFIHEQSRFDRDEFVEVIWSAIDPKYEKQFEKLPENFLGPLRDSPFDYQSIMLYGPQTFAKESGGVTMKSKGPHSIEPSKLGLSPSDILRVKKWFRLD